MAEKCKKIFKLGKTDVNIEMTADAVTSNRSSDNEMESPNIRTRVMQRWLPSWNNPIWHLPFFQLANYTRFTDDLIQVAAARQICLDDLTCLERLNFLGKKLVDPLRKHSGERALRDVTAQQSRIEGNYIQVRMIEAIFESGPQFILQMAIILKTGAVEYHQLVSMVISLLSFWYSTTQCMLEMPTCKTPIRTASAMDYVNIFVPSFFITLVRLCAWSFLLSYLDIIVLLPVVVTIVLPIVVLRKSLTFATDNSDFINLVASALVPCVVKDEYSGLYVKNNIWTALPMLASLFLTMGISPEISGHPPILKCFCNTTGIHEYVDNWIETPNRVRCWYNNNDTDNPVMTDICADSWITLGDNGHLVGGSMKLFKDYRTLCDPYTSQMYYVWLGLLAGGLVLSLIFARCWLQPYLDPFTRVRYFSRCRSSWNEFYLTERQAVNDFLHNQGCQLLIPAVTDNIESLVKHIVLTKTNDNINQEDILLAKQAIQIARKKWQPCHSGAT